jgi:hypothetical protein
MIIEDGKKTALLGDAQALLPPFLADVIDLNEGKSYHPFSR